MVFSGVFWILTYLLIIRRGFQEKTFGMPLAALCLNISWEFIFSFVKPHFEPYIYVNIVAFSLDFIILIQLLSFWRREFPEKSGKFFHLMLLSTLISSFSVVLLLSNLLNDSIGFHIAFIQNLLMSTLFILMLHNRDGVRGQSIYIAIFKMIGTLIASLAFGIYDPIERGSIFLNTFYLSILLVDLVYTLMFYKKSKNLNIVVWTRF
jgi:hypothetical protein